MVSTISEAVNIIWRQLFAVIIAPSSAKMVPNLGGKVSALRWSFIFANGPRRDPTSILKIFLSTCQIFEWKISFPAQPECNPCTWVDFSSPDVYEWLNAQDWLRSLTNDRFQNILRVSSLFYTRKFHVSFLEMMITWHDHLFRSIEHIWDIVSLTFVERNLRV